MKFWGVVALAALVLQGCGGATPSDPAQEARESSGLACRHFRNIATDVSEGILTDAELREKLKEVDDNAIIGTPEVQQAARAMLSAITQDDGVALGNAVTQMGDACSAAGW